MVDPVIGRPAVGRHPPVGHVREVGRTQATGRVHLGEEHFLRRAARGPARLDPPLERAELTAREATGMFPREWPEQGQRLQPGMEGPSLDDARPGVGERVRVSAPGMRHPYLAGEPAEPAVLTRGLGTHARPEGGDRSGCAPRVRPPQPPNRRTRGEHPEPSITWVRVT